MAVKIRIHDFQSIKEAEIVVEGLTVITGANNSGKTSVNRAFTGVFSNPGGDAFVRHGAEKFSVEVQFDDGNKVKWEKGPKVKPTYVLNGKTIHPGRVVPEEVLALGVHPIPAGSGSVWPQVAPQFTGQVFLLDLPGSSIAEAVADVNRVGRLTQALRFAESDKRGATSDLKVRRQDVADAGSELSAFDGLDDVSTLVSAVEHLTAGVTKAEAAVTVANGCRNRLQMAQAALSLFDGYDATCMPPEGTVEVVRAAKATLVAAQGIRKRLCGNREVRSRLSGVRDIAVPPITTPVVGVKTSLQEAQALRNALQSAKRQCQVLRVVLADTQEVDFTGMGDVTQKAQKAEKLHLLCVGFQVSLTKTQREINTLQTLLGDKKTTLASVEVEVVDLLSQIGVCPVCKSPAANHVHQGTT